MRVVRSRSARTASARHFHGPCTLPGPLIKALIEQGGASLRSAAVRSPYELASSTMHKMLDTFDARAVVGEEETIGPIRHRLEDPFRPPAPTAPARSHVSAGRAEHGPNSPRATAR